MGSLFSGCYSLTSIDMSHINTSNAITIDSIFKGCKSLTSINISHFDTKNAKLFYDMFSGCELITYLDLSNFDTSNADTMQHMFENCTSLVSLNLSKFDTSKVTRMEYMFNNCQFISSLDLSNFNTSKVNNMEHMFDNCKSLISLNLSNFDTSSVTNMNYMFQNCLSLSSLNLSNFSMENIKTLIYMFYNCENLEYINLQNSRTNATKTSLFDGTLKNIVVCAEYDIFRNYLPECGIIDCSETWRENQKKINLENNNCTDDCILVNNKYDYLSKCYDSCPIGAYANNYKCENCHPDCKTCLGPGNINNTNCKSCFSTEKYLKFGNCVSTCDNGYYIDENNSSMKICKCDLEKCFSCSEESLSINLCISCNENYYPKSNELNNNNYINCYNSPEGYYLDINDSIYRPCYSLCKSCDKDGNEIEHNCLEYNTDYVISDSEVNDYNISDSNSIININTYESYPINYYNECN